MTRMVKYGTGCSLLGALFAAAVLEDLGMIDVPRRGYPAFLLGICLWALAVLVSDGRKGRIELEFGEPIRRDKNPTYFAVTLALGLAGAIAVTVVMAYLTFVGVDW